MACYVDRLIDYSGRVDYRYKVWCHLVADTDAELLACAAELGIAEAWLQGSRVWDHHFDLPAPLRPRAVELGAVEVDFRFMGRRTRARRAALSFGADVAVGAPDPAVIDVPLPLGRWHAGSVPAGVALSWAESHPLLGSVPVVRLVSPGPARGVVTLHRDTEDTRSAATVRAGHRDTGWRIGVVVGGALPPS